MHIQIDDTRCDRFIHLCHSNTILDNQNSDITIKRWLLYVWQASNVLKHLKKSTCSSTSKWRWNVFSQEACYQSDLYLNSHLSRYLMFTCAVSYTMYLEQRLRKCNTKVCISISIIYIVCVVLMLINSKGRCFVHNYTMFLSSGALVWKIFIWLMWQHTRDLSANFHSLRQKKDQEITIWKLLAVSATTHTYEKSSQHLYIDTMGSVWITEPCRRLSSLTKLTTFICFQPSFYAELSAFCICM